jgi:hypothetical protein
MHSLVISSISADFSCVYLIRLFADVIVRSDFPIIILDWEREWDRDFSFACYFLDSIRCSGFQSYLSSSYYVQLRDNETKLPILSNCSLELVSTILDPWDNFWSVMVLWSVMVRFPKITLGTTSDDLSTRDYCMLLMYPEMFGFKTPDSLACCSILAKFISGCLFYLPFVLRKLVNSI